MIVIVDYGLGNLGSIKNMLRKIGYDATISAEKTTIEAASKLILPGIGAFDSGMNHLLETGVVDVLHTRALEDEIPVLGICLGAQLMTRRSDEGETPGLGWFEADTRKMVFDGIAGKWPLPNIGWRDVSRQNDYAILTGYGNHMPRFYFVHSYYLDADTPDIVSMTAKYGFEFACGLHRGNLHCAQFHPEKSHTFGKQFLKNFAGMDA